MPDFTKAFYASNPDAEKRDDEQLSLNRDLESSLIPKPKQAAAGIEWQPAPGGMKRVDHLSGTAMILRNENGTVTQENVAYEPPVPPVDTNRSYAELLIADIPKRIQMMDRNLAAGDIQAATKEREQIEAFINENKADLYRFTRYTGRDKLAATAAQTALGLVTSTWMTEEQNRNFDPRSNPKSAANEAMKRGMSPVATKYFEAARYGTGKEAEIANSLFRAAGEPDLPAGRRAASQAPAQQPGYNRGTDGFIEYADGALSKIRSALPDVLDNPAMNADAVASHIKTLFDAGDADAGYSLVSLAADNASSVSGDPLDKANAFKANAQAYASALTAMSDGSPDPAVNSRNAKLVASIARQLPSNQPAARTQLPFVAKRVSDELGVLESGGRPISDSTAERFARVRYHQIANPSVPLTDQKDIAVSDLLNKAGSMSRSIVASAVVPTDEKTGTPQPAYSGFSSLASLMKSSVSAATAVSMETGVPIEQTIIDQAESLGKTMQTVGLLGDSKDPTATARLLLGPLAAGKNVDASKLDESIARSGLVQAMVSKSDVSVSLPGPRLPAEPFKAPGSTLGLAVDAWEAKNRKFDMPPADAQFLAEILTADIGKRTIESTGDRVAITAALDRSFERVVPEVFLGRSKMFSYLTSVPIRDLRDQETIKAAAEIAVSSFKDTYGDIATRGIPEQELAALAEKAASTASLELARAASREGAFFSDDKDKSSTSSFSAALPPAVVRRVAGSLDTVELPASGSRATAEAVSKMVTGNTAAGKSVPTETIKFSAGADYAASLRKAFLKDIDRPEFAENRGIGIAVREKVNRLAALRTIKTGDAQEDTVSFDAVLGMTPEQVAEGYKGVASISSMLRKPIRDKQVEKLVYETIPKRLESAKVSLADSIIGPIPLQLMAAGGADIVDISRESYKWLQTSEAGQRRTQDAADLEKHRGVKQVDAEFSDTGLGE